MRRLLPLYLLAALLFGACVPNVTLLTREPASTPTSEATPRLYTATPPPTPTPIPGIAEGPEIANGLQVNFWHGADGQTASLLAQMATEFNLSNPQGITVQITAHTNLAQLTEAIDAGQEPFDLLLTLPEQSQPRQEILVDLSPYASDPEVGIDSADIPPAFWQQSSLGDFRYGVPAIRSARFLFYNLTWAAELGFSQPPQTWEAFSEQACAANAWWKTDNDETNDGYGGLALDVAPNWQTPYGWLRALSGDLLSDGQLVFETDANLAAFEQLAELRSKGCAWLPGTVSNFEHLAARRALFITGSLGDFIEQKTALALAGSGDQWTVLPFPGDPAVVPVYGLDFSIHKSDNARQMAAWLFTRWMLEPTQQARWAKDAGLLPVRNAAQALLKSEFAATPQWGAAASLVKDAVVSPQTSDWRLGKSVLADGFLAYFQVFPTYTLKSVLAEMDATMEELNK